MDTTAGDPADRYGFEAMSLAELAAALGELGNEEAAVQYRLLCCLAEFDRRQGWAIDGALSCVDWLTARCGLARRTAFEKLRVAHELRCRPVLCEAAGAGRLTWCQLRLITRVTNVAEGVDRALVQAAEQACVVDLERLVRYWQMLQDQETPPDEQTLRSRGVRVRRHGEGLTLIELALPDADAHELLTDIDAQLLARTNPTTGMEGHERHPVDECPRGHSVDKSAKVDNPVDDPPEPPPDGATWGQRRADALVELVRAGRSAAGTDADGAPAAERRTVHVLVDYDRLVGVGTGTAELFGGLPISGHTLRRMACDAGIVRHVARGHSEVLDVGRRTQTWTVAQRRALIAIFGGRCAFPGCWRSLLEVHHIEHWGLGGPTDLDNGVPLCWSHHHLVHEGGWSVLGCPLDATLAFVAPGGTLHPAQYPVRLAA